MSEHGALGTPASTAPRPDARERALQAGRAAFGEGWQSTRIAEAPGRLELLGNHIDYNGGPVLAAAIDRFVVVAVDDRPADEGIIEVVVADDAAGNDGSTQRYNADDVRAWRNSTAPQSPHDYVRGAIASVLGRNARQRERSGRLAIAGDVPIGFGLSSSAALCVSLVLALSDQPLTDRDLVLAAQEAEHRAGTPCGTMDQSASVGGGIILYDGTTVSFERMNPDLSRLVFAVADSGVHHSLGESSYPVRVKESSEALAISRDFFGRDIPNLAALSLDDLQRLERADPSPLSPTLLQRVRHVVTETARVRAGIEAVQVGDWVTFGRLMTESGRSSAGDYAISHPLVEELVSEALTLDSVLGARMMGGGEGGTALILLPGADVPALRERLAAGYYMRHHVSDSGTPVHIFGFAPGAHVERVNS